MNIGSTIRKLRESKKISRKELVKLSGISWHNLVSIEIGRNNDPKLSTLLKVSQALKVTIDKLIK